MVNYKNGKIYKILDLTNDNFYIGSTTKEYLSQRLEKHRTNYNYYLDGKSNYTSSFEIISNENYKIYLLQNCSCASKDELRQKEQYWIDRLNCIKMVNKYKAFRTEEQTKKEKKEKQKIWYENNKDKIAEKDKIYQKNNKEKILEYRKANVQCDRCNAIVQKHSFKRHQQSKSCINALPHGLICELAD